MTVTSFPMVASAMDDGLRSAARSLVNRGIDLFEAGQFAEARHALMEAYQVVKVPTVALWAARANQRMGNLVAAEELYREALSLQPTELWVDNTQPEAQLQASTELSALQTRLPHLTIRVDGPIPSSAQVTLDGVSLPLYLLGSAHPVDPGLHIVALQLGRALVTERVTLEESEEKTLSIRTPQDSAQTRGISPAESRAETPSQSPVPEAPPREVLHHEKRTLPQPKDSFQHTAGWLSVAMGTVGFAWGGVAGAVVAHKHQQLINDGCTSRHCVGDEFHAPVAKYQTWQYLSTSGFIVGGLGAIAGLTLLLTSPTPSPKSRATLRVSPNALEYAASF